MSMREVRHVKQDDRSLLSRWFAGTECDLHVWQHKATNEIVHFQFCFDKGHDEHILEWRIKGGLRYAAVDDGESRGAMHAKSSPIMIADGELDWEHILATYEANSEAIDNAIRRFVRNRLREARGFTPE